LLHNVLNVKEFFNTVFTEVNTDNNKKITHEIYA